MKGTAVQWWNYVFSKWKVESFSKQNVPNSFLKTSFKRISDNTSLPPSQQFSCVKTTFGEGELFCHLCWAMCTGSLNGAAKINQQLPTPSMVFMWKNCREIRRSPSSAWRSHLNCLFFPFIFFFKKKQFPSAAVVHREHVQDSVNKWRNTLHSLLPIHTIIAVCPRGVFILSAFMWGLVAASPLYLVTPQVFPQSYMCSSYCWLSPTSIRWWDATRPEVNAQHVSCHLLPVEERRSG